MHPCRVVVFLPCHTLDDLPAWLAEQEADDVLAAWTAAWDPALLASIGRTADWASVDLRPPDDGPLLGIVPAAHDERFAAQADAVCTGGSRWIRGVRGAAEMAAAAREAVGLTSGTEVVPLADDFRALGLAMLLAELLARRMRSETGLEATAFGTTAVAAARAAVAGEAEEARQRLAECFGFLAATRARYYAVDLWLLDLVLLADTTLGRPLLEELAAPTPLGVVATGAVVERLAAENPAALERLRTRCAEGSVAACGGRDTDAPLGSSIPEHLLASFARGRASWLQHAGCVPRTFARAGGGGSALLPALLDGLGYDGAVWPLFDGTPVPDPGAACFRWQGTGGGSIAAVGRPPLDVREARTILALPERLGDAMDHDHVAVVICGHYAGTASPWFAMLRRVASWCDVLGTFVTPDDLFERTVGGVSDVAFDPDAFPEPPAAGVSPANALDSAVAAATDAARRAEAAGVSLRPLLAAAVTPPAVPHRGPAVAGGRSRWPWSRRTDATELVLDNGLVRLEAHPRSGGLLSLRRPQDRANRLSQQIAVRTTRAATAGAWEAAEDRAEHGRMQADAVARMKTAAGIDCLESRGRLLTADGRSAGTFTQRMELVPGMPLMILDIDVRLDHPPQGPLFESHVACRFAWHENESVELLRSVHAQAVATQRTRFTAPHFVLVRGGTGESADDVTILPGGLPWHVRCSPHVIDTVLVAAGATAASRRLAVGLGLERPWDRGLALLAGDVAAAGLAGPATVRLASGGVEPAVGGRIRAVVDVIESAGRKGEVRVACARPPLAARACDFAGRPREDVTVAIDGATVVVFLERYAWLRLHLDLPA